MKGTQRVTNFKENFMELHHQGYTIGEIADMFKVSNRWAYKVLQEIADQNGISRESLLKKPIQGGYSRKPYTRERIEGENLLAHVRESEEKVLSLISKINKRIEQTEEM